MATKKKSSRFFFDSTVSKKTLHKNLEFTAVEQYKLLRANLSFTLPEGVKCPIIGVTSSMRGEGKSTTAINLSYVLAESGKSVLLMDISSTPGLTDLLMGYESHQMGVFKTNLLENWYVMPSGDLPPNPSELLGSRRMESILKLAAEKFDYIVVDLPPVNVVSDALAISKYITGMIVVIREDYTEKKELEACFRQLKLSNVNVLGCVMNEAESLGGTHGRYKKYSKYYRKYYTSSGSQQK